MNRKIIGFHKDRVGDWVADLECGHTQHFRHQPPWINRPWLESNSEREKFIGTEVVCKTCEEIAMDATLSNDEIFRYSFTAVADPLPTYQSLKVLPDTPREH